MSVCDSDTSVLMLSVSELSSPSLAPLYQKIEKLVNERFRSNYKVSDWKKDIAFFAVGKIILHKEPTLLAVCFLRPDNGSYFIHTLCSVPPPSNCRGSGCCKKLMSSVRDAFSRTTLVLRVEDKNFAAIKCYESSGFKKVSEPEPGVQKMVAEPKRI